jgi:hypothetical protein
MFVLEMLDGMVEDAENRRMVSRWIEELTNTLRKNANSDTIPLEKSRASVVNDIKRSATHIARLVEKIK